MTGDAEVDWDALVSELSSVSHVGPSRIERVRAVFATPAELAAADQSELEDIPGISAMTAYRVLEATRRVCMPETPEEDDQDAVPARAGSPADDGRNLSRIRAHPDADSPYIVWADGTVTVVERARRRRRFDRVGEVDLDPRGAPVRPGRHGTARFQSGCRCDECVSAWSNAYGAAAERLAGATLDEIADRLGITREGARRITEKVAPWRPWNAVSTERRVVSAEVAASDPEVSQRCRLCGGEFSGTLAELANRGFCRVAHRKMWTAIRYHADEEYRERQIRASARWALFHQDRSTPAQRRQARRVLDYPTDETGDRWLVEGSKPFRVAVTALREGWPVFDRLEPRIQHQVRDWDAANPGVDPRRAAGSPTD